MGGCAGVGAGHWMCGGWEVLGKFMGTNRLGRRYTGTLARRAAASKRTPRGEPSQDWLSAHQLLRLSKALRSPRQARLSVCQELPRPRLPAWWNATPRARVSTSAGSAPPGMRRSSSQRLSRVGRCVRSWRLRGRCRSGTSSSLPGPGGGWREAQGCTFQGQIGHS